MSIFNKTTEEAFRSGYVEGVKFAANLGFQENPYRGYDRRAILGLAELEDAWDIGFETGSKELNEQ
jgi:hypothetical protein